MSIDSHNGIRRGVLELIRCTEQTAILMAGAEGRGIRREELATYGTLSMSAFMSASDFRVNMSVYDEIYEHDQSGSRLATEPALLWGNLCKHRVNGRQNPEDPDLDLDFCFAPIDGKHALSLGQTGGTTSALCFAARNPEHPPFLLPRVCRMAERAGPGKKSDANLSPPWLVICGGEEFVRDCGGIDALRAFVQARANQAANKDVSELLQSIFSSTRCSPLPKPNLPIAIHSALAALAEPRDSRLWQRFLTADYKKRMFSGSSIALALAAFFPSKGFDCSVAITRHIHAIHASIAARTKGGVLLAVPLYGVVKKKEFLVEEGRVLTHEDFVRTNDAALIVSGISENVVLKPVRFRGNYAEVHTLSLSARTKSVRSVEHRLELKGDSGTRFISYEPQSALSNLSARRSPADAQWGYAGEWCEKYEQMFAQSKRTGDLSRTR